MEPQVEDALWWRGMRMKITEVDEARGHVRYENVHPDGHYRCTSNLGELVYREDLELWILPRTEGVLPKVLRGEIVDPELPRCESCGEVTFRAKRCTQCRLMGAN